MVNMVFTPVASEIREKVLSYFLAGHGRNKIDRELRSQGIKAFGMILKELGYDISAGVMWHFDTNKELKKLGLEDRHVNHILILTELELIAVKVWILIVQK